MTIFPHSRLFPGSEKTIAVSGPHLQVVDNASGSVLFATTSFEGPEKEALLKSGPIRCVDTDTAHQHIATAGDDKILKVWGVGGLKLLSQREVPKKPTVIRFTRDGQTILVADKFGDIFSYPLHPDPAGAPPTPSNKALSSHDNPAGGHLVLGHTSMLTTFLLTADEKYVVSADRDEHIRVSWYPQGYCIERFCLGHEKFVSAIHTPAFAPSTLISGGGDPTLKVWDWMSGALVRDVPIQDAVMRFMKVPAPKQRQAWDNENGAEGKGKKRKREKKTESKTPQPEEGYGGPSSETAPIPAGDASTSAKADSEPEFIVAVQRIESVESSLGNQCLLFTVTGCTALFCYSLEPEGSGLKATYDFRSPVLDFIQAEDRPGHFWVLVDVAYGAETHVLSRPVRFIRWDGAELTEVLSTESPLLSALNSQCIIPATNGDLEKLDLYSPLFVLPKNTQAEHDPMDRDAVELPDEGGTEGGGKTLSGKELARLTRKQKLDAQLKATDHLADVERDVKKRRAEDGDGMDLS